MSPTQKLKTRRREDYPYILDYRTRWADNDMYHHLNNSIYNFLYDSIVNTYLMTRCGLSPAASSQYGLVVHSHGDFFGSVSFPAVVELGLRVNKLGRTSVTYEIGLFERGVEVVKAVGEFVHVFVERETGRPSKQGMHPRLREGLEMILVADADGVGSKL